MHILTGQQNYTKTPEPVFLGTFSLSLCIVRAFFVITILMHGHIMVVVFLDAVLYQTALVTCTMCRDVNRDSVRY